MTDSTEQKDSKDELNLDVVAEPDDSENTEQKEDEVTEATEATDVKSELNLNDKTKQKLKSIKGQIQTLGEKIRDDEISQDDYNSTEEWLKTAVEERYPELFNTEVKEPGMKDQIKTALKEEADDARFKVMRDSIPKDLSADKKQMLESEYELLRDRNFSQAEALERAMDMARVSQPNDFKANTERAIRINNGSIPSFGNSAKPRAERAIIEEDQSLVDEMSKYGVKLDAKTLKSAREKGII